MTPSEDRCSVVTASATVGSTPVELRYLGPVVAVRYVQEFVQDAFFGSASPRLDTASCIYGDVLDAVGHLAREACDLAAVTVRSDDVPAVMADGDVGPLPLRVHMVLDLSGSWQDVEARLSRREAKRGARWRTDPRHSSRFSTDPEDYFSFYAQMVEPSMRRFYGERSRMLDEESGYEQVFRRGGLFLVEVDGEPVAGSVSEVDSDSGRVTGRIIGVRDGDASLRNNGAQNAVYHEIISWAWRNGFAEVDFGNSEAFLSKGIFQYKMRFGTTVALPPGPHADLRTILRWNPASDAAAAFLAHNPPILIDEDRRFGVAYGIRNGEDEPARAVRYLPSTGIAFERHVPLPAPGARPEPVH